MNPDDQISAPVDYHLEHRKRERHGPGWEAMRDAVESEGGWPLGLTRFADHIDTRTIQ